MIGKTYAKYAARNLLRRPRRTLLSVIGIAVGCAIGMVAVSFYSGSADMQVAAASECGAGHLRVVPRGWPQTRENALRLADLPNVLAAVERTEGVRQTAVRARVNGLLAFGNRTAGVEVVGVQGEAEPAANRIVRKAELTGRYLRSGDDREVVIGRALATRLDVELDDDLMVTVSGRGGMQAAMLRICGILATGSRELDLSICHVALGKLNEITGYHGAGEVAVLLDDPRALEPARAALAAKLPAGNVVVTWKQVSPALAANVEGDLAFANILCGIIIFVVALGITSAQLTAVLERRRELGILMALGMKARHVTGLIFLEAALTGLAGSAAALAIGGPIAWWMAAKGVDISGLFGGETAAGGVLFDPVVHARFGVWIVWYAVGVSVAATLAAALHPAWFAARTDPAEALRTV